MINVTDKKKKLAIVNANNRRMVRYEDKMFKDVKKVLKRQYNAAIKTLRSMSLDTDGAIDNLKRQLQEAFEINFIRIATDFGELAIEEAGQAKTKGPFEDYMNSILNTLKALAAEKVVQVNNTTKNAIRRAVKKGFDEGLTNREIAKRISKTKEITTTIRAKTIARTETHGIANKALRESMQKTNIIKFKEWISVKDDRTRTEAFDHLSDFPAGPNGEIVALEEAFQGTGEPLMEPGDPSGSASAGNVINCRCGQLFHTRPNPEI